MKQIFMCFVQILEVLVWTCGVEEQGASDLGGVGLDM